MQFTLTITGTMTPELLAALTSSQDGGSVATTSQVAGKDKPAKVQKSDKPKSEDIMPPAEEGGKTVSLEQLREVVTAKSQGGKLKEIKAVLAEFSVARVTDLTQDQYAAVLDKVNAI